MFLLRALTSPRSPFCPQAYGGCLRVASGGIQRRDGETQRGAAAGAEANYEIYSYDLMRFYSYSDLMGYQWDIPSGKLT